MVEKRAVPGLEEFEKEFNNDDIKKSNFIGGGAFGSVYAIKSKKDGRIYALKNID